jgi:hypothetical protein
MIGDKRLEMPKTVGDCSRIFKEFQLKNVHVADEAFFPNARRLVELNNEIYEKLQHNCDDCGLMQKEKDALA